jgi:hypothetical protein
MAEVKVGFCAIVCHEDFAVLVRIHGSSIYVDVRIELHRGNGEASISENSAKACGRDALSD